jgi:ATP-dependent Clp protease ATP-binding subunit ClpA
MTTLNQKSSKMNGSLTTEPDSFSDEAWSLLLIAEQSARRWRHKNLDVEHLIEVLFRNKKYQKYTNSLPVNHQELNEILERIVEKNPPPISGRFRPNLKFVQLQSNRPFTISIHGNKLKDISNSYTKYIEKQFRKELDLKGVPIKIFYKTDDNPFKDKKNKLTERQLKKRSRIRRR